MTVVTEPDTAIQAEQEGALPGRCPPLPPMTPERAALLLAELEESCGRRGLPSTW
jgi:hypothetical protein